VKNAEHVAETSMKVPYHVPSIGEEEIAEVVDTLRSGWLTTGPKVRRFEREFAAFTGAQHAIAVSSCTGALHLAQEAIGVGRGDEVIIPAYTFTATAAMAIQLGARPVLADSSAQSPHVDARSIEPLVTDRTKAIIVVHFAGQACDMDPIMELARCHHIAVVEDAAHAIPATYRGRMVGTLGDVAGFSFYATKTITTGEGGMVTTDREDLAERIHRMRLFGLNADAWNRYSDRGSWYYEVEDHGFKYNMSDIAAAIGVHQLRQADALQKRRREIALAYSEGFQGLDTCSTPTEPPSDLHAWHLYVLSLNLDALGKGRDDVMRELAARGIGTSVHFMPLNLHPAYQRSFGYGPGMCPSAERHFDGAISLPIYPDMSAESVDHVINTTRETLARFRR
jgi:perosamine synthetase